MIAYHFVGKTLRDGRAIPKNGVWLKHKGDLVMCEEGLHASKHPFDALQYAPGETLCKVKVRGKIIGGGNKLVATERMIVARFDATELLRKFGRLCALDVIDKWDAPEVIVKYLNTGDESLRDAAWDAAGGAARDAAWAAAGAAARGAARAAAWDAARDAARAAQRKRFASMVNKAFKEMT